MPANDHVPQTPFLQGLPNSISLAWLVFLQNIDALTIGTTPLSDLMQYSSTRMAILGFTRDLTAASGNQPITGLSFMPQNVIVMACRNSGAALEWSVGFFASANNRCLRADSAGKMQMETNLISVETSAGATQTATCYAFIDGGMGLSWVKTGSPAGTAQCYALFFA